eukprot:scaffold12797_cov129-Isochrysis_galbana.AAC.5
MVECERDPRLSPASPTSEGEAGFTPPALPVAVKSPSTSAVGVRNLVKPTPVRVPAASGRRSLAFGRRGAAQGRPPPDAGFDSWRCTAGWTCPQSRSSPLHP